MKIANMKLIGLTALLSCFVVGNAQAVVVVNTLVTATSGAGVIGAGGLTISGVTVGDTITVELTVDNTQADTVISLFTTMTFDQAVIDLTGGGTAATLLAGAGFGAPALGLIAQPAQKFGRPAGEFIALAHASTTGPATGLGPELAGQLVFTVMGGGTSDLVQFIGVGDDSIINGSANVPGNSPGIAFSDAIVVTVPEPSAILMSFASLGSLAMVVGIRRRQ